MAWCLPHSGSGEFTVVEMAVQLLRRLGDELDPGATVLRAAGGPNWGEAGGADAAPAGAGHGGVGALLPGTWDELAHVQHLPLHDDGEIGQATVNELHKQKCKGPVAAVLSYYRQAGLLQQMECQSGSSEAVGDACAECEQTMATEATHDVSEDEGDKIIKRFNALMDQEGEVRPGAGCGMLTSVGKLIEVQLTDLEHLQRDAEFTQAYRNMPQAARCAHHVVEVGGVLYGALPEAVDTGLFCGKCQKPGSADHTTFVTFDYGRPPAAVCVRGCAASGSCVVVIDPVTGRRRWRRLSCRK